MSLVTVTGSSGFIGMHVVKKLLTCGYRVRGTLRNLDDRQKAKPLRDLVPNSDHPIELVQADLLNKECWRTAINGANYVFHLASPFCIDDSKINEQKVIDETVQGTLNVLKACAQSGSVRKVIYTSSLATVKAAPPYETDRIYSEADWQEVCPGLTAWRKAKILAEKEAVEFVKKLDCQRKFDLTILNPAWTIGPVLTSTHRPSMEPFRRIIENEFPFLPNINWPVIDVRDVAQVNINCIKISEIANQRLILCSGESFSFKEIAEICLKTLKPFGYNFTTKTGPDFIWKLLTKFDGQMNNIKDFIGVPKLQYDGSKMQCTMQVKPSCPSRAIADMALSMHNSGFVGKKIISDMNLIKRGCNENEMKKRPFKNTLKQQDC